MMERLTEICQQELTKFGWSADKRYVKRLRWELSEIEAKNKAEYFLNFYDKKIRYPVNQNNLLICKLLGVCQDFSIEQQPNCKYGEYPDIDSDFTSEVRDYLKNEWAIKEFGEAYVCNISTYGTYKLKAAFLDMARVLDKNHDEIQAITKNIPDKDDDNKPITWDTAMKLYPELKKYCEVNPDVAEAAKRLVNRNKSFGIHAGGLIIANQPLSDLVPLVKRGDDPQAAAWPEGLSGQDLGPIGLVKFDLLVIDGLLQIAYACRLAKQRHGLAGICAKPGQGDWTDLEAWRNDPASLATADKGDLTCVFQFDSPGIQKLAKDGGVTRFEDLVVYSSIWRPGALSMQMDKVYVERKRGRQEFSIHPLLKSVLEPTYGIISYQEQIMQILHIVGDIPLKDCEIIRKAISKKKIEYFAKYKEMFIRNGMRNLNWSQQQVEEFWLSLESYSEYGFNRSLDSNTIIKTKSNGAVSEKSIENFMPGDIVFCVDECGNTVETEVLAVHDHGVLEGYEITFDDGYQLTCTLDHKFLTEKGQLPLREIIGSNSDVLCDENFTQDNAITSQHNEIGISELVSEHAPISNTRRLVRRKIVRVVSVGKRQMYDLEVANPTHNFLLSTGIVTSNSHSVAYTYVSMKMLYLKTHFPHEFYTATLAYEHIIEKIKQYKMETQNHGIKVHRLDINKSKETFSLEGDEIYYGFNKIKGIGKEAAKRIVAGQPYKNFEDFLIRCGTESSVLKPIVALRCFTEADPITLWKFAEKFKKQHRNFIASKKIHHRSFIRYQQEFETHSRGEKLILAELPDDYSFDGPEWKERFDFDEVRLGWREKECDPTEEGAEKRIITKKIQVTPDCLVEKEEVKYFKRMRGVKKYNRWKMIKALWNRFKKLRHRAVVAQLPKLSEFDASKRSLPDEMIKMLRDVEACEREYYGFEWIHDLEKSPDYTGGKTFAALKLDPNTKANAVEIKVLGVIEKTSKKNKNFVFHQVECEDVTGEIGKMNIWPDDWERWGPEFKKGNLLKVRMMPPSGGFPTFTFDCPPKQFRWKVPARKEDDYRVIVMRPAVKQVDQILTHEEVLEQFDV